MRIRPSWIASTSFLILVPSQAWISIQPHNAIPRTFNPRHHEIGYVSGCVDRPPLLQVSLGFSPDSSVNLPSASFHSNGFPAAVGSLQAIDSNSLFRGWKGETPIVRQEYVLEDGRTQVSYYSVKPDGSLTRLNPSTWQGSRKRGPVNDPPGLAQGRIILAQQNSQVTSSELVFSIDTNSQKLEELEQAIRDWQDGKRDAEKGFPQVPAKLKLIWTPSGGKPVVIWEESRSLSASGGEAGYSYSPPDLSLAVLSPTGKTLLAELTTGESIEYRVIAMPAKSTQGLRGNSSNSPKCKSPGTMVGRTPKK